MPHEGLQSHPPLQSEPIRQSFPAPRQSFPRRSGGGSGSGSTPAPPPPVIPVNIVDGQEVSFTPDPSQFEQIGTTTTGGGIFISPIAQQSTEIISTGSTSPTQFQSFSRQQTAEQQTRGGGFSGRVQESFRGTPTQERFFVGGREVASLQEGAETFQPQLGEGEEARLTFQDEKGRGQVQITRQSLLQREEQFIPRSDSAQDLMFYGDRPTSVLTLPEKPEGFLSELQSDIQRRQDEVLTESQRGQQGFRNQLKGFGLGIAFTGVGTAQFFKTVATQSPVKTSKDILSGVKGLSTRVKTGEGIPELGKIIRQQPGFVTGVAAGELLIFKSPRLIIKGSDLFRTRGKIEIPIESVVAREFLVNQQRFPSISKGQTAGQLLEEFKPSTQFGVTRLRGFTAAPSPFPKQTQVLKGTSELAGVFQSPKISPHFLRVSSENQKLFSFSFFDTFRPSVMKIEPINFELASGIPSSQKSLVPISQVRKQFIDPKNLGKSIIPFIKTEKEAVIPVGTNVKLIDKRFFFMFEGRRVPIFEFDVVKGGDIVKDSMGIQKAIASSSRGINPRGVISPIEVVSFSKISSQSLPKQDLLITKTNLFPSSSRAVSRKVFSIVPSSSIPKPRRISRGSSSGSSSSVSNFLSTSRITPSISKLKSPTKSSGIISFPKSPFISQPRSPFFAPPSSSGSGIGIPRTPLTPLTPIGTPRFKILPHRKPKPFKGFPVLVRRRGIFRVAGFGRTPRQAVGIGRNIVSKTLAASFKVPSFKGTQITGLRTKKGKKGLIFIEPRRQRLSTRGETTEIQKFLKQSMKGGIR